MSLFSRFPFNKDKIEQEIAILEQQTSAELRVYIERHLPTPGQNISVLDRTLAVFQELEMDQTQARNAVLIYIAYKDHRCAVIGDLGIHQYVGDEFWQRQYQQMIVAFAKKHYTEGVVVAIQQIGEELVKHFPIQPNDINELANEVIIND
ncbi:MAG: TPM domain-containing protein [Lonepinella koalarum]|nr:TPM domain-containing protein [Lonepinella koalarum]